MPVAGRPRAAAQQRAWLHAMLRDGSKKPAYVVCDDAAGFRYPVSAAYLAKTICDAGHQEMCQQTPGATRSGAAHLTRLGNSRSASTPFRRRYGWLCQTPAGCDPRHASIGQTPTHVYYTSSAWTPPSSAPTAGDWALGLPRVARGQPPLQSCLRLTAPNPRVGCGRR